MDILKMTLLIIHVASGYTALGAGFFSILSTKGSKLHVNSGLLFYYGMVAVALSAIGLSTLVWNPFLFHIAVFVAYQNYGGRKAVRVKTLKSDKWDMLNTVFGGANAAFMVISGQVVLLVFGFIQAFLVTQDIRNYIREYKGKAVPPKAWLVKHIGHMMGAFIGALTAFLVVNTPPIQPGWVIWLAPTALLVPLMQYWIWKFTRKRKVAL